MECGALEPLCPNPGFISSRSGTLSSPHNLLLLKWGQQSTCLHRTVNALVPGKLGAECMSARQVF